MYQRNDLLPFAGSGDAHAAVGAVRPGVGGGQALALRAPGRTSRLVHCSLRAREGSCHARYRQGLPRLPAR
jgi:hypothetical protein